MIEVLPALTFGESLFRAAYAWCLSRMSGYAISTPLLHRTFSPPKSKECHYFPIIRVAGHTPFDLDTERTMQYLDKGLVPQARLQLVGEFWRAKFFAAFREELRNHCVLHPPPTKAPRRSLVISWRTHPTWSSKALASVTPNSSVPFPPVSESMTIVPAFEMERVLSVASSVGAEHLTFVYQGDVGPPLGSLPLPSTSLRLSPARMFQFLRQADVVLLNSDYSDDWWAGFLSTNDVHFVSPPNGSGREPG